MKIIIVNTLWLILERVSLSLSGIFVSIYVARYLGPAQFGTLNYLLATIAIVVPLVQLGADSVIFNRIARRPNSGIRLMQASMSLRRRLFLLVVLPWLVWSASTQPLVNQWMTLLLLVSAYFSIQDVYKIYYDARLQSKRNTLINNLALLLSILLRLGLVSAALSPVWFAVPYILSSAVPYWIRHWLFQREQPLQPEFSPRQIGRYARYLLSVGLPLAISSLSIVIYTRIDQIMLGNLMDDRAVGWYSAAITLGQGWTFVPMALIVSLMPGIANNREPQEREYRIRLLYLLVLVTSLPVLLGLTLFAWPIIKLLYGEAFEPAAGILALSGLTAMFSVLGTVSYRSMVLFAGYRFIAIKMPLVALANVLMNLVLIPRYGLTGAAISTLLAEFLSFFVLNSFFRGGIITRLQLTCFCCLPRLISYLRKEHVKYTG
ncbi:polysaccharide biosynthesis protein [Chania multitudinisentens RB-25]|uniref:Polysaccharide biosynthesis protein n=1 Tax=Chania multitudinisentens RB-25 TaxID=1441930 RepID=W0LI25_9GAMM|nr:flippase [Chania multitudinisentens]AHG22099.1 polysaccharide biosynthesis protein [Chania multitudinisentens RB-25]